MRSESNSASRLDLLSIIVEPVTDDRLGSVFVRGDGLLREGGVVDGIIKLFVISPVRATDTVSEKAHTVAKKGREQQESRSYLATLDILLWIGWGLRGG